MWLINNIIWQHSQHIAETCFIKFWMWKKLVECILRDIYSAAICDVFVIHELVYNIIYRWQFIFYFTEDCFLVCHLLFMINYFLFMIDFWIPHANFKLFIWLFSEYSYWWFLIKNIEESIHGYVLPCSISNLDLFWNASTISASKHFYLNEYVSSIFIYLISKMINYLMELAIPN